jgi:hypothetical protein
LLVLGLCGGAALPALGATHKVRPASSASSASSTSAETAAAAPNQALVDATQNLVQALVKSVQSVQSTQPTASDARAEHALALARELPDSAAITPPSEVWAVPRDAQLQAVLSDWCKRAGWTLVWQSDYGYRIEAAASFDGNFQSAVTGLFTAMAGVSPPIYPEIYKGNRVVLVKNSPAH